jgi:ATP-dependent DNA helicase DinG
MNIHQFFAAQGPLAAVLVRTYSSRSEQVSMAQAVDGAIDEDAALLANSPTGTGKILAYLVPLALAGRRVFLMYILSGLGSYIRT